MADTTHLYTDTDWQQSSGPYIVRAVHLADIWPVGLASEAGGGNKDVLADGKHPLITIGPKASRAVDNLTGVVVSYTAAATIVQVNIAKGFICRQYVANVLTYNGGNAATWDASLALGEPVYVDDSDPLADGITLSRSPLNSAGNANPLAGWIWYEQDEYADSGVGGPNASAGLPKAAAAGETAYTLLAVLLK